MKKNFTLLYVEDDPVVQENFTEIFKTYFNTVLTTDNGNEAFAIYEKNHIDIAILDISIKGINGISLATKIRENDSKTPILMISAYSDREKLLKAVNLHLSGYLVKPVSLEELERNLNKILQELENTELIPLRYNFFWNEQENLIVYNEEKVKLTKNEKTIIELLLKNNNSYMSALSIQEEIFPLGGDNAKQNNIVQLLSRLKKKIIKKYEIEDYFIENCYGLGYRVVITN